MAKILKTIYKYSVSMRKGAQISLVLKKLHIKSQWDTTVPEAPKSRGLMMIFVTEDTEQLKFLLLLVEAWIVKTTLKILQLYLLKLNNICTYKPTDSCKRKLIISLSTIALNYKCLTVGEWINMAYAHNRIIPRKTKDKLLL